MGDIHRSKWMSQLPFTLLGRRVALQEDLGASPADLTLGGAPVLPGVLIPDTPTTQTNHELLTTLQQKAAEPAVPMSRHCDPEVVNEPKDFNTATHVYIRVDKPENLGQKFQGPFVIVDRPSNTTVTIKVGVNKEGFPLLENHHWHNCRIAYLHPDVQDASRPKRGRPSSSTSTTTLTPNQQTSTMEPESLAGNITQPRLESSRDQFVLPPAAGADDGSTYNAISTSPPISLNDVQLTGLPQQKPFTNQNNFSPQPESSSSATQPGTSSTPGPEPGREPLPPEVNGRLAPPVTKGAPSTPVATADPPEPLLDHDYARVPSALGDHNYFKPMPETAVRPPPGFENYVPGRPQRTVKQPAKFSDYEMS